MIDQIASLLVQFANHAGYFGVYLYMFLVGTFIPVPSEILLIPSGYLASIGEKNYWLLLLSGALGSLSGALLNYHLAKWLVQKYREKKIIKKTILFFKHHGKISVFLAPLTPGLGQYISIPAGISHMPLKNFIPLTFVANCIWVGFMLLIGYLFGEGKKAHSMEIWLSLSLLGFVILSASVYVFQELKKEKI